MLSCAYSWQLASSHHLMGPPMGYGYGGGAPPYAPWQQTLPQWQSPLDTGPAPAFPSQYWQSPASSLGPAAMHMQGAQGQPNLEGSCQAFWSTPMHAGGGAPSQYAAGPTGPADGTLPSHAQHPPGLTPSQVPPPQPSGDSAPEETRPPTPPPPPPEPVTMAICLLSCPGNKTEFKTAAIRSSILSTAKLLGFENVTLVVQADRGRTGPYSILMPKELGMRLAEDEETSLYPQTESETVDPVDFKVSLLDEHGRATDSATLDRIQAKRAARRAEKDLDEKSRTIPFFMNGNPEMLRMMGSADPRPRQDCVLIASEFIKERIGPIERSNVTQLLDEHDEPLNEDCLYVVLKPGDTKEAFFGRIPPEIFAQLKYIVVNGRMAPVKVRLPSAVCGVANVKPCCFRTECIVEGGTCGARLRTLRTLSIPSSVPPPNYRAERQSLKEHRTLSRKRQKLVDDERASVVQRKICPRWIKGICPRHGGDHGGKCQWRHGTMEETTVKPCGFGVNCTTKNAGCLYSHAVPTEPPPQDEFPPLTQGEMCAESSPLFRSVPAPLIPPHDEHPTSL